VALGLVDPEEGAKPLLRFLSIEPLLFLVGHLSITLGSCMVLFALLAELRLRVPLLAAVDAHERVTIERRDQTAITGITARTLAAALNRGVVCGLLQLDDKSWSRHLRLELEVIRDIGIRHGSAKKMSANPLCNNNNDREPQNCYGKSNWSSWLSRFIAKRFINAAMLGAALNDIQAFSPSSALLHVHLHCWIANAAMQMQMQQCGTWAEVWMSINAVNAATKQGGNELSFRRNELGI
jgi:hypothetical protein